MRRREAAARSGRSLAVCDWLVAVFAAAAIGAFALLADFDWSARREAFTREGLQTVNAASAALGDALARQERVLATLDNHGTEGDRDNLDQFVAALASLDPDLREAVMVDADGAVVARSAPGISASVLVRVIDESAHALKMALAAPVYFSTVIGDPATGGDIVAIAGARYTSEGQWAGLALLVVDRAWFDRAIRSVTAPGRLDILRSDQTLLFSTPEATATPEHIPVLSYLVPVAKSPFLLRYRQPIDNLCADWRAAWVGNGILLAFGMTAVMAAMALRQHRQRRALLQLVKRRMRKNLTKNLILRRSLGEAAAAAQRADEASAGRSRFFALVTHELRTPLNAILGFSEVIQRELFGPAGEPRYVKFAAHIHEAGTHLLSLIDDLLDMAKVEAGKMEIAPIRASAAALARSALDIVGMAAQQRDIALTASGCETCPDLFVDLRAGKQVLINLLSNAIKFTPRGGHVELRFAATADDGVTVTVIDSGVGMSAEEIAIALEPFGRVAKGDSGEPGTGLGLPLARALVRLHGGELSVTSQPGHGTTVAAIFPPQAGSACDPRIVTLPTAGKMATAEAA
jgi:signal transduction histidine kinase